MRRTRLRRRSQKARAANNSLIVDADARRKFMSEATSCELCDWWIDNGYPESLPPQVADKIRRGTAFPAQDPHHVTPQSRRIDERWNLVAICRADHDWVQWRPEGLLYCLAVLARRGDLRIDLMDIAFRRSVLDYLVLKSADWCDFSLKTLKTILSTRNT
jgi:hypothetical protein